MLTIEDVRAVLAYYDHASVQSGKKPATSIDHVIPLSKGGKNVRSNLQPLTVAENKAKGDEIADFRPQDKPFCPDDYKAGEAQGIQEAEDADWASIENEYITTNISLRNLAYKSRVSFSTLRYRAEHGEWTRKRGEFRHKVVAELAQKVADAYVDAKSEAVRVAQNVIASWLSPWGMPASATDALNAAKLLLLTEGEPTERVEYLNKLRKLVTEDELGQTGAAEGAELKGDWILRAALTAADSPSS